MTSLAITKFAGSKRAPHLALLDFIEHHIKAIATPHDSQYYRNGSANGSRLYTKQLDIVFKRHLDLLKEVFDLYGGRKKGITFGECTKLADDIGILDAVLTNRDLKLVYLYSRGTMVNEIVSDELLQAGSFVEFIELCGRLADMKDFTPLYSSLMSSPGQKIQELRKELGMFSDDEAGFPQIDMWKSHSSEVTLKANLLMFMMGIPVTRNRKGVIPFKLAAHISVLANHILTT